MSTLHPEDQPPDFDGEQTEAEQDESDLAETDAPKGFRPGKIMNCVGHQGRRTR